MEEQVRQRWSSTVKSINHQRRKPTFNEGNRRSTININSQRQSSTIASRFYTYLLSAATISTIKMADNIRSRSDNSKRSITIGNQKSIYPKGKDRDFINSQKRKCNGSRSYLKSRSNFAVVDAIAQQCLGTGAFRPVSKIAATSDDDRHDVGTSALRRQIQKYLRCLFIVFWWSN